MFLKIYFLAREANFKGMCNVGEGVGGVYLLYENINNRAEER